MGTRRHLEGILFDTAYLEPEIHLWVRADDGRLLTAYLPFYPVCYLAGPKAVVERAVKRAVQTDTVDTLGWTRRVEFWSGEPRPVFALRLLRPGRAVKMARSLLHAERHLTLYDVDLDPTLVFHGMHGLFPLARVALSYDPEPVQNDGHGQKKGEHAVERGRLVFIRGLDDPWDPDYRLPPLKTLTLRLARPPLLSLEQGNTLVAEANGDSCEIGAHNTGKGLRALNDLLERHDPDLIDSVRGDQTIFPWLLEAAQNTGVAFTPDRAAPAVHRLITRRTRSIVVYGQVLFKAAAYPLLGRWHLDRDNSFFIAKAGLEGLVELARLSRMPVQRQARASGGTAMTAMEIHLALQRGILVPFIKDQVEDFRPASELLRADKGGLSYFPPEGLHEQVIELDFHQQYPTIMAVHNISPETMDCACCPGQNPIPGVAHHTCGRRRGLVPEALQGLLTKRLQYKQRIKTCSPEDASRYDARQSAIKWTLVTTFGYQGFKSAKFGHIAAHEAITAWGRETLLIAKETFEEAGYRLLHALTDSLYVVKPGYAEEELHALTWQVQGSTGLTLGVEGVYDWICFPPSKVRAELSVATRYFGRFADGTLKVRGLRVRQHNTPLMVRQAQRAFLGIMKECRGRDELEAAAPRLKAAYAEALSLLWRGRVQAEALAVAARVSREPGDYRSNSPVSVCLRLLGQRGIRIPPGQKIRYVIVNRREKDPLRRYLPEPFFDEMRDYDAEAYAGMLLDAFREVTFALKGVRSAWAPPEQEVMVFREP